MSKRKRKRVPGTWRYMHTHRGVDFGNCIGARVSPYPENFKFLAPKVVTLGMRHQSVTRFVVKVLIDEPTYKVRLYMGGGELYFVREDVIDGVRHIAGSICYGDLARAMIAYKNKKICYTEFQTIPS